MSLLDLFGINKEAKKSDVIRNAPKIESKIEKTKTRADELLKEINPDLVNNLQNNFFEIGPSKIETPISKAYDFLTEGRFDNPFNRNNRFGILDLVQTGKFLSNPTFTSGIFSPIAPFAIKGIASLISNIRNPYKGAFGGLNKQTIDAIQKERISDFYDRFDKGQVDLSGGITAAQDKARGDYSRNGGGKTGGGFSSAERGAALHG